jgi:hypothetical protein
MELDYRRAFYLADPRLAQIEDDLALGVESDDDAMRYLRHERDTPSTYAYRLYERADWRQTFGPYSRPYRDRYRRIRSHLTLSVTSWVYAQKHPTKTSPNRSRCGSHRALIGVRHTPTGRARKTRVR